MAEDDQVRTGQEEADRGDRFHQDSPVPGVAQLGVVRGLGFLGFPGFDPDVIDQGKLEFFVFLNEGGHPVALHHRIGIFEAVAQAAGGGIHQGLIFRNAQVGKEDVELLGQVDINRGGGQDPVGEADGAGPDLLIGFFLDRTQNQVLPPAFLRDFF